MTSKYEIENLLRPPVEYSSATVSYIFAGACIVAPYKLSMSPPVALFFAGLFFCFNLIMLSLWPFMSFLGVMIVEQIFGYVLTLTHLECFQNVGLGFR